jgi:WD40 repeat protein
LFFLLKLNIDVNALNFTEHTDEVYSLSNGDIVSRDKSGIVKVWNPSTGLVSLNFTGHENGVRALAHLPNDEVVRGSDDRTIQVWDPSTGTVRLYLTGHAKQVSALTILSSGDIVSGSLDITIKVWNSTDGTLKLNITTTCTVYALTHLPSEFGLTN